MPMQGININRTATSTAGSTWAGSTVLPRPLVQRMGVSGFILKACRVSSQYMRHLLWLSFCGGLFINTLAADTYQIQYQVSGPSNGPGTYQYTYYVDDLSGNFIANQEIDIQFDGTAFSSLSNPTTDNANWDVTVPFTFNQPGWCGTGCMGDFLPYYVGATPSNTATFTLNASYTGSGTPGSQTFLIEDFNNPTDPPPTLIGSGTTTLYGSTPEPANVALSVA